MSFKSGPIDPELLGLIRKSCAHWEAFGDHWAADHERDAYLYFYGRDPLDRDIPEEYKLVWKGTTYSLFVMREPFLTISRHSGSYSTIFVKVCCFYPTSTNGSSVWRNHTIETKYKPEIESIVSEGLIAFHSKFKQGKVITVKFITSFNSSVHITTDDLWYSQLKQLMCNIPWGIFIILATALIFCVILYCNS